MAKVYEARNTLSCSFVNRLIFALIFYAAFLVFAILKTDSPYWRTSSYNQPHMVF